jgi:hypothetical protein
VSKGRDLVFTLPFFQSAAMETHGLAGKMIAKMPKIARDCESPVRLPETAALNSSSTLVSCGKLKEGSREPLPMEPNSIVVVSLHSPKEKIWGILLSLNPSGITVRGIDLNSFDHFVSQINQLDAERVGLPTVFFPMTRVERVSLDEPSGSIPSMADIFQRKIGRSLFDYLAQFA